MDYGTYHFSSDKAPIMGVALYLDTPHGYLHVPTLDFYKPNLRKDPQDDPHLSFKKPCLEVSEHEMADKLERRMQEYYRLELGFPETKIRETIAVLRGQTVTEVKRVRPKQAAPVRAASADGKTPGVVASIIECLKTGWSSKEEITRFLATRFPDRDPIGMSKTVNTQLNRIPKKKNIPIECNGFSYRIVE